MEGDQQHLLVVDDDPKILALVSSPMKAAGYHVTTVSSGVAALEECALHQPALVVLDLVMAGMSGIEVLRRLREWYEGPVLILSVQGGSRQKVEALDLGADDYLTKPFNVEELLARVRAAIRRVQRVQGETGDERGSIQAGEVVIDLTRRVVTRGGQQVRLTRTEYQLLRYLAVNAGKVTTHQELLRAVWGPEYSSEAEYLRTFIKQLRKKLESSPVHPSLIVTHPGVGYRFVLQESDPDR